MRQPPPAGLRYRLGQATTKLTLASLLAPMMGAVVELSLAWRFGVSGVTDAYRVAQVILALGSALFFVQLLPHVLVPLFTECRTRIGEEEAAWRFALTFGTLVAGAVAAFVVFAWVTPGWVTQILGPGLHGAARQHADFLVRYFAVAVGLMACCGIANGLLHSYGVFHLLPLSQCLANVLLAAAIALSGRPDQSASLAAGVVSGGVAGLLLHAWRIWALARKRRLRTAAILRIGLGPESIRAIRLCVWVAATVGLHYYVVVVFQRVLSRFPPGTISEYGYAWKLLALVSIAPTALATVVFPALAEASARAVPGESARFAARSLRMGLFVTAPLLLWMCVFRREVVGLLLGQGAMKPGSVEAISGFFGLLLWGALAVPLTTLSLKLLYAHKRVWPPAAVSLMVALVCTWMVPAAARVGGPAGVAWASNAAGWLTAAGLRACQKLGGPSGGFLRLGGYAVRLAVVTAGVGAAAFLARCLFLDRTGAGGWPWAFLLSAGAGIALACRLSAWLGIEEMTLLADYGRWQFASLRDSCARLAGTGNVAAQRRGDDIA